MVKLYVKYIDEGIITLEDVPERWYAQVKEILDNRTK